MDEALTLLGQYGDDAKILAGGHSLLPALKLRLSSVGHLIDIGRIADLAYIKEDQGKLCLGARTSHYQVESSSVVQQQCPLLAECAGNIGDVQVRNRGTFGGSLAHADPAADYPAAILALEAEIQAVRNGGKRVIKAEDFFVDMLTTALQAGEIITEVRICLLLRKPGASTSKCHNRRQALRSSVLRPSSRLTPAANAPQFVLGSPERRPKHFAPKTLKLR